MDSNTVFKLIFILFSVQYLKFEEINCCNKISPSSGFKFFELLSTLQINNGFHGVSIHGNELGCKLA